MNEAGTVVRFTFTDKELHSPPPEPAVRMKGRMVESVPMPGAVRMGTFTLRLDGPKGVSKADMLSRAIAIGMARVFAAGIDSKDGRVIMGGSIGESLDDDANTVELSLQWKMAATAGRSGGKLTAELRGGARAAVGIGIGLLFGPVGGSYFGGVRGPEPSPQPNAQGRDKAAIPVTAQWVGLPLAGTDSARGVAPPLFGTAEYVRLVAAALGDPCGAEADFHEGELRAGGPGEPEFLRPGGPAAGGTVVGTSPAGGTASATVVSGLEPDDADGLYADLAAAGAAGAGAAAPGVGFYEHYTLTSTYRHDSGAVALPSTRPGEPKAVVRLHNPSMDLVVEFSAARVGGPPAVPDPTEAGPDVVYRRGSVSAGHIELAADGVTPVYTVSGLYEFEVLDPCAVSITAPVPPYLDGQIGGEARIAVGVAGAGLLFGPGAAGGRVNIFCGVGIEVVGEHTGELRSGAGPEFPGQSARRSAFGTQL